MRADVSIDAAIWQVIGPLSSLGLTYMNGETSDADVAHTIALAKDHLISISRMLTTEGDTEK